VVGGARVCERACVVEGVVLAASHGTPALPLVQERMDKPPAWVTMVSEGRKVADHETVASANLMMGSSA
jgi:hypothetical protein